MRDPVSIGECGNVQVVAHLIAPDDQVALDPKSLIFVDYAALVAEWLKANPVRRKTTKTVQK